MRNDEAAIIALCRSKSQNLSGIPLDRDGIVSFEWIDCLKDISKLILFLQVVYDERTAL